MSRLGQFEPRRRSSRTGSPSSVGGCRVHDDLDHRSGERSLADDVADASSAARGRQEDGDAFGWSLTRKILQFATPFVLCYVLHRRGNRAVHHACFPTAFICFPFSGSADNVPFAGSPTKTLLRLLLPLRAKAQRGSTYEPVLPSRRCLPLFTGACHGWSDGRCVQRVNPTSWVGRSLRSGTEEPHTRSDLRRGDEVSLGDRLYLKGVSTPTDI